PEDHAQAGAHERVVVDDDDADAGRDVVAHGAEDLMERRAHRDHGSHAQTTKPPVASSPASRVPPRSVTRSWRPRSPWPDAGRRASRAVPSTDAASARAGRPGTPRVPGVRTMTVSPSSGDPTIRTTTGDAGACLRAFVSPSWTTRY